ncbi:MAG: hypothetical protein HY062_13870 [Bacteroidetes bacterium]|nr:hypothetical protein [Bacteroidota bacterium]
MMKNLIVLFSVLAAGVCMSCKKDYVCVCTNSNTGTVSYGDHFKANVITKKAAEESCKANNDLSAGGLKDCHLE